MQFLKTIQANYSSTVIEAEQLLSTGNETRNSPGKFLSLNGENKILKETYLIPVIAAKLQSKQNKSNK